MSVTFNFNGAIRRSISAFGPAAPGDQARSKDGLLISPEASKPAQGQFLASLTLFLLGLALVAATLVFIAALIGIALS